MTIARTLILAALAGCFVGALFALVTPSPAGATTFHHATGGQNDDGALETGPRAGRHQPVASAAQSPFPVNSVFKAAIQFRSTALRQCRAEQTRLTATCWTGRTQCTRRYVAIELGTGRGIGRFYECDQMMHAGILPLYLNPRQCWQLARVFPSGAIYSDNDWSCPAR